MVKKLLLCLMCLVLVAPSAMAERKGLRIIVDKAWEGVDMLANWPDTLEMTDDILNEMATVFASRNNQVDLFIFPAEKALYAVKKHGYYASLTTSRKIKEKQRDLYPAFQQALTTEDGDLVGWVVDARVMGMTVDRELLEEAGMQPPETFGELLDCCQAILDKGLLPANASLFGKNAYTRQGMLDVYMDQYIRASQLGGGTVDFLDDVFVTMAQRIRTELPETDPAFGNPLVTRSVFNYPEGFDYISEDVLPMPQVLPGKAGLLDVHPVIAVVNPYSRSKRNAVAWVEAFTPYRVASYVFDKTITEPAKARDWRQMSHDLDEAINALETIKHPTEEQREELDLLRQRFKELDEDYWSISREDIAAYKAASDGLSILEASPVTYDEALRTAAKRFLNGAFDAEGFAKECQNHITMIYLENSIAMN